MIVDFDLEFLREAAALVDANIERQERNASASPDPDGFGIFDHVEYVVGFGFVACQTYLVAIASRKRLVKKDYLGLGPKHRTGRSMAELINAAANCWKHSPEWCLDGWTSRSDSTLNVISSLGVDTNGLHPLANTLYEILAPHPARFENLIPFVIRWRDALPR